MNLEFSNIHYRFKLFFYKITDAYKVEPLLYTERSKILLILAFRGFGPTITK